MFRTHVGTLTTEDRIYALHLLADDARMAGRDDRAERLERQAADLLRKLERANGHFDAYAYANTTTEARVRGWSA